MSRKYRIAVDFPTLAAAKEFFATLVHTGVIPPDTSLYRMDGLDELKGSSGITRSNTLIVRRKGDRPGQMEVA